jgi:hypothetical protein
MCAYFSREEMVKYIETTRRSYGKSVAFGCRFIAQSLSRMFTLWLDVNEELHAGIMASR